MASKQVEANGGGRFQVFVPGTTRSIAVASSAAATSAAFTPGVSVVRVAVESACYIVFGASPTAATTDMYMPAGAVEYFGIPADGSWKLSAIRQTADGVLRVTEGAVS